MWPWTMLKLILNAIGILTEAIDNLANDVREQTRIDLQTARQVDALFHHFGLEVSDLEIVITPNSERKTTMANKKATGSPIEIACLAAKTSGKRAVMPDQTLTSAPASITLQPVDVNGAAVPLTSADSVTGTLASDSGSFVIGAGADTRHYVATIPANITFGTVANLAATEVGTIQNAPANLAASLKLTLNIPPSPVAVDLDIILA